MTDGAGFWDDADVISVYTRGQAIADGVLIDITELVRHYFKYPVAVTAAVWRMLDTIPAWSGYESVGARARDMAHMLCYQASTQRTDVLLFNILITKPGGGPRKARLVTLKSHIGPGDDYASVITIMLPEED
jgi:hypothetical protein